MGEQEQEQEDTDGATPLPGTSEGNAEDTTTPPTAPDGEDGHNPPLTETVQEQTTSPFLEDHNPDKKL